MVNLIKYYIIYLFFHILTSFSLYFFLFLRLCISLPPSLSLPLFFLFLSLFLSLSLFLFLFSLIAGFVQYSAILAALEARHAERNKLYGQGTDIDHEC